MKMKMLTLVWETVVLAWDTARYVGRLARGLSESRRLRRSLSRCNPPEGTPAKEIAFLLAALEDPELLVGKSEWGPLVQIRRTLWRARYELDDLVEYAMASRGDNSEETLSALRTIVGKWEEESLPLLRQLTQNPETHPETRKIAKRWMDVLTNRSYGTGLGP